MKKTLKITTAILCLSAATSLSINAQTDKSKENPKLNDKTTQNGKTEASANALKTPLKPDATPDELAQAAIAAHGGDKFKNMRSLVLRGTVDVTSSTLNQAIAGSFVIVFKNDKYRLQIQTPMIQFVQAFDGSETYSSVGNFRLPPLNRMGLQLLQKSGETGFKIEALADKKKRGFRIVSPEGFTTDYFLDEKTGRVKSYSATYQVGERSATTIIENDKFREVEGVLLPEKYAQRFDGMGQTFYSNFKVKEILVNSEIADDVFSNVQPN